MHVIEPSAVGGAESVVRAYSLSTLERGVPVRVATLSQSVGESPFASDLRGAGVPVTSIHCGRRRYWKEVGKLADELERHQVELVHTHVYHADFVGYWAARRRGIPVVATAHGQTGGGWKNRAYQRLDSWLLSRFDAVFAVSQPVRDNLVRAGCRDGAVHRLPNPYSPRVSLDRAGARRRLDLPSDEPAIAWIGRMSHEKGPDLFVEAVSAIEPPRPLGLMIGDGPERPRVIRQIDRRGLAGTVRTVGEVPDAAALLPAFDCLVISSRTEGVPMVLLEAAGAGVPVVSFEVGGIPDVVDHGTAWLVPSGDGAGLTRAIRDVLTSQAEARRRAERAGAVVRERFGVERWLEATYRVYDEVLRA